MSFSPRCYYSAEGFRVVTRDFPPTPPVSPPAQVVPQAAPARQAATPPAEGSVADGPNGKQP